jgi:hypothetical protein
VNLARGIRRAWIVAWVLGLGLSFLVALNEYRVDELRFGEERERAQEGAMEAAHACLLERLEKDLGIRRLDDFCGRGPISFEERRQTSLSRTTPFECQRILWETHVLPTDLDDARARAMPECQPRWHPGERALLDRMTPFVAFLLGWTVLWWGVFLTGTWISRDFYE